MIPKLLLLSLTLVATSSTAAPLPPLEAGPVPSVSAGRIERLSIDGNARVAGRAVDVWLPPDYPARAPYAVALMFDGQMLFDAGTTWNQQEWGADETAAALQASGRTRPFLIVAVPNAGPARHAEYFPQAPFEALPEPVRRGLLADARRGESPLFSRAPYSDDFLKWIDETVLPSVASRFAVSPAADDRVAIGASMGGLIAMYAVLERPSAFGGFGALSTHWPGIFPEANNPVPPSFFRYVEDGLPSPGQHRLYFDHGTATLDALYPPLQAEVDRIGVTRGWQFPAWRSLSFPGAPHTEEAWAARLPGVFAFLLPPEDPAQLSPTTP